MKEISTEKEYFERFYKPKRKKNKILFTAFQTALDTRKFEIELYWKRATYFWAFIAAMFVAYFAILNSEKINTFKGITILIAFLGYFFSLGWYFVNRGSKYWQENWEAHVDLLGSKIQGELFTTIKNSNQCFYKLNKEYPFSVSKVNQLLSLLMLLTWLGLFIFSIFFSFDKLYYFNFISEEFFWLVLIILFMLIMIFSKYFFNSSKSFIKNHKIRNQNTTFLVKDNNMNL